MQSARVLIFVFIVFGYRAKEKLAHKKDKVKVMVYLDIFFKQHVRPVTEKLSFFLDIALVRYGKASTIEINGKHYFKCQHGEKECYANKIQACAIEVLGIMTLPVKMTECMIADDWDADKALLRCADQEQIDLESIWNCAANGYGSVLLKKHGDDTDLIIPTFIPTIIINGSIGDQFSIFTQFLFEVVN